ncbi:MAG: acyl-CoA dehydrogenase family protein [Myxococcales bacterium]|nr:acyl-CoA dehydrogenase family protein [Myxococcales bacterium]
MNLSFSPEELAFRDEVRAWIAGALPESMKAKLDGNFSHDDSMAWHKLLAKKGWVAPHWPAEYGGPGLDSTRRFILTEELELAGTPQLSPFGLVMVGPLIMQFGTDAQKKRFLPKILSGEEVWCQGYSEPNAGSDLASLQMRADDDGNGNFVVNGQKTWTTYAQYADWIFCLVRTDSTVKKQAGISFLLIDMKTPGIDVRPTLTIGGTPAFCETFFENVVVPKENLVGPLNAGWTLAKALLGHERTLIAAVGASRRALRRVKTIAARTALDGDHSLLDEPRFADRVARLEVRLKALQMANYRALASAQLGHAPGAESSILKLVGSEILQDCFALAMEAMGHNSLTWFNDGVVADIEAFVPNAWAYTRATTIYGGSNEIQKNIIAKWILGLPAAGK